MKIESIDIYKTIEDAKRQIAQEKISPALKTTLELLFLVVTLLSNKLGLNSANSSKPPSSDPNRTKKTRAKSTQKPGGQPGHVGIQLQPVSDPDHVEVIPVDRTQLPPGKYQDDGFESRQVFDFKISRVVTEYRAQALKDTHGKRYVADFPGEVTQAVQYGRGIKAHAVYLSQFQLLPYQRVQDYFAQKCGLPLSTGSLVNFNKEAYRLLEKFDALTKQKLIEAPIAHADETGINVGGKRTWLHSLSNDRYAYLYPHAKRGAEAMDEIGILPSFQGTLIHDHWKPYFAYKNCAHALCNAHHLRELECAKEQYGQVWAGKMQTLLRAMNQAVEESGGALSRIDAKIYLTQYREIISEGIQACPIEPPPKQKKRGRVKKTKPQNLVERLRDYETEVLGFMTDPKIPFTNNLGENDIRMTKVQQKISGCFRSMEGAQIFCRLRSYILTCQKHDFSPADGLRMLFGGNLPGFAHA